MKTKTLLAIVTIGATLTFTARADFFDNFDSYANQAAFNAVWTAQSGGAVLSLETTTVSSAPNAISQSTTVAAQVTHLMAAAPLTGLDWTFNYYLSANSTRDFAQLYSRAGTLWSSGLNGALSLGDYNTTLAGKFSARYTPATPANGAIFGDGATIISSTDTTGWFALSIAKSTGWNSMEVKAFADPNHAGKDVIDFYVNGVLGGSIANATPYDLNFAVLGGGVSTGSGAATTLSAYDNFSVVVPEPSSIALAIMGGFALAIGAISRRKV